MAATVQNNTSAQIGKRLADGEQAQKIAAEFGMTETSFSRSRSQYYEAYILSLQTELNAAKTTATQLQGVNNGLQKSCEKLQTAVTELQANASTAAVTSEQMQVMETNLHEVTRRLQQSETNLQVVSERLQVTDAKLQEVTTKLQDTRQQLQEVEEERDQYGATLQSLVYIRKPILEQRTLTHPRFLLWAIFFFEGYNGWQLYENMKLQQFPYFMAFVFATFFGLASVTALAANHRWGVILCVTAAFFSNAIHADLFTYPSLSGLFYTLLPCLLILLFADMYKKINIL
jgi:hypothetical protein